MKKYIDNITADSLTGAIFALEGISDGVVFLNGPTGCKFYHGATSAAQMLHVEKEDIYPEYWYFGQSRVPCTFIDKRDYVYGSCEKLKEGIKYLDEHNDLKMLAIVNAPGASLIGDDIKKIVREVLPNTPCVVLQTLGYSLNKAYGYKLAMKETINVLCDKSKEIKENTVNILGISIFEKYHEGDILELKRLLKLCGITVNCTLSSYCTVEEIKNLSSAKLNIVLHKDTGEEIGKVLKEKFDTPYICPDLPLGFKETEKWIKEICEHMKLDPSPCLEEIFKSRARAYWYIKRINTITGVPTGATYAIEGTFETVYAYCHFFSEYFGMIVNGIRILDEENTEYKKECLDYLKSIDRESAIKNTDLKDCDLVFASGITLARLKAEGQTPSCIEISLPSIGYEDILPKTFLGIYGALFLTEKILNALTINVFK